MVVAALVKRFGPRRGGDDGASSAGSSASAHKRSKRRSATGGAAGAGAGAGVGTPTTPLHKRISPLSLAGSGGSSPSVAPRKHVIAGAATSSALAAAAAAGAPVAATGEPYIPSQPRPGQPMPYNTMAARPTVGNGAQSYSLPTPGLAPPVFVPTVAQHGMHAATTKPPAWGRSRFAVLLFLFMVGSQLHIMQPAQVYPPPASRLLQRQHLSKFTSTAASF